MMPTSPFDPDALPDDVADALANAPADERTALLQAWHAAGEIAPPPASTARRATTWAVLQEQMAAGAQRVPRRAMDRAPLRPRLRRYARSGTLLAALLVASAAYFWRSQPAPSTWTATGESNVISLADGSTVRLEPGASLHALGGGPEARRFALSGSAAFDVAADAARPFSVQTPHATVTVLGTEFSVRTDGPERTRVAVREGRVAVQNATHERIELQRGEQAIVEARAPLVVRPVPESEQAVFTFDDAALSVVLREIELLFGTSISYPAALAGERLTITRHGPLDVQELLQSVCAPIGLRYRTAPGGFEVYRPA